MRYKTDQQEQTSRVHLTGGIHTDINSRLRDVRDALGMSNADIARGSGLTRAYISRVVNDQTNVGLDLLIYLSTQHSISVDWLLTGKGAMFQRTSGIISDIDSLRTEFRALREVVERYVVKDN